MKLCPVEHYAVTSADFFFAIVMQFSPLYSVFETTATFFPKI